MSSLLEEALLLHKKGQLKRAENLYKSILKSSPSNFEVIHLLGIIKIQLKQFEEAIVWLNKAIVINPNNHSVFNNLGVCYKELEKYPEALNNFNAALKIKPDYAEVYNNLGIIYKFLENYKDAIKNYNEAIKLKPEYAEAYNNLGLIYLKQEKFEMAKNLFEQATKLKPSYFEAYNNLGNVYKNLKNYNYSIKYYILALKFNKNYLEAINNLGVIYLNQEQFDEAKNLFVQAIKIKPDYTEAINNLGTVYLNQEQFDEAKNLFEQAIKIKPDYTEAINNLGLVFLQLKDLKKAKINIDKALILNNNFQNCYVALGYYFQSIEDHKNAELNYKRAIEIKGKDVSVYLALLYLDLNNIEESEKILNRLIKLKPNDAKNYIYRSIVYNNTEEFYLSLQDLEKAFKLDDGLYKSSYKIFMLICAKNKFCDWDSNKRLKNNLLNITQKKDLKHLDAFGLFTIMDNIELTQNVTIDKVEQLSLGISRTVFNINKNKKIKIGYYSPDFHEHPVGYIISELFAHHDKSKFEIIGFSLNPNYRTSSQIRNEIINRLDNFVECGNDNYLEIVEKSKNLKIDLAIDLAGFTSRNRFKSFIKKVAPIQINYLGYPGTMGPFHDYIVADLEVIPKEKQKFYSEKIIYMPGTFLPSFTKFDLSSNLTKENFSLKEKDFVFANFNSHHKITPIIFNSWMRILKKVKNSILWLNEGNKYSRENLRKEANNRGVDIERIIFSKSMNYFNHTIKYKFCDLFLDTFPYNAHSTASSCLLSGCPLITVKGDSFHTRVGSSILLNLNLSELICENIQEYENKATTIANSHQELQRIKNKLYNSLINSKTFNTKNHTENLEKAYNKIYERYNQKLKPENIFIE
jgi:predicted O-linked N-acetylglucosamine transferase (SPINDLY family)